MSLDALFDEMGQAAERAQRGQRIPLGRTHLALREYGVTQSKTKGTIIYASFSVLASDTLPVDSHVSQAWCVSKLGWQGEQELSRAQAFTKALLGIPDPVEAAKEAKKLVNPGQPGRGIQIIANGVQTGKPKYDAAGQKVSDGYVEAQWEHVAGQAGETIAKVRAHLDATAPLQERAAPAKPAYQAPTAQPTPAAAPAAGGSILGSLGIKLGG